MHYTDLIRDLRLQLWGIIYPQWRADLFSVRWWFIASIIAICYAIWWKYVDKHRLSNILLFGSFIAVSRIIMDDFGASVGGFVYTIRLIPLGHALFLNDLTVFPLAFMLVYQYCSTWKSFLVWSVIADAVLCFAFLPLLSSLEILQLYTWRYYYTFLIILGIAIVMRAIMLTVLWFEEQDGTLERSELPSTILAQPARRHQFSKSDSDKQKR
ncbi:hypothetical protein H1S01_05995 [Heliobacterium chlorum]|uniref:Uncharacterized protein n=1 Tax=Heliobacterium chlorum TaxID=2698 RepID=A0ABR7SZU4_HELCL|nr:CBO0543 family protein [Heliobacterium chlorum]MBC9784064.1 hypothetical protein [Heliobacterium chlorum]